MRNTSDNNLKTIRNKSEKHPTLQKIDKYQKQIRNKSKNDQKKSDKHQTKVKL